MRRLVLVAMMVGVAQGALAADMPDFPPLRGFVSDAPRTTRTNWEGFYVGGQAGYSAADMDFTGATRGLAAQLLFGTSIENEGHVSTWPILGKASGHGKGFGGFAGYNWQWDDAVVGVEVNYTYGGVSGYSSGSMQRFLTTSNGYTNDITYDGTASLNVKQMGTARVRGAYSYNGMLPYMFGAASFGIADMTKSVHIFGNQHNGSLPIGDPFRDVPFDLSATEIHNDRLIVGFGGGTGVDILLVGGLFARAEYEFVRFVSPANVSIHTGRVGAGYKF
jgi:opacity protein-like surface antigen